MKTNNKIYKLFGLVFLSVLFLTSCNDTVGEEITYDTFDKSNIENAPLEKQIEYANKYLLDIGKVVVKLTHNREFKSVLYNSVYKRTNNGFDNTVLVKDLIVDINTNGKNKNIFFLSEEDKISLQKSLEAFYDLDGQNWHPEIVILNFEEKYQKFISSDKNKSSDSNNTLVVPVVYEDNDESTEDAYIAYQEGKDDELVQLDYTVTQSDAITKDILFIKIAESCEDQEMMGVEELSLCPEDPESGGGGTNYTYKFYLDKMTGKHHKETIGRSEIEVKTQAYFVTGHFPLSKVKLLETSRNVQYSYSRSQIRNEESRYINSRYIYAEPIPSVGEIYYAVEIFEYDSWPAPKETRMISKTLSNGEVLKIPFDIRSWQSPYNEEIKEDIPTWSFEKNSIKYNFKYKY